MNDLRIKGVTFSEEMLQVEFSDNRTLVIPIGSFPRLQHASRAEREQWQLIGRGLGVHWELVDEDLSVENILLAYSRTKSEQYARSSSA